MMTLSVMIHKRHLKAPHLANPMCDARMRHSLMPGSTLWDCGIICCIHSHKLYLLRLLPQPEAGQQRRIQIKIIRIKRGLVCHLLVSF
jgi:hypothetical protein